MIDCLQHLDHFLRHQEWQADMARTAMLLTESSKKIRKILDESSQSQFKMLEALLAQQKQSLSKGRILSAELIRSRNSAKDLYEEFQTTYQDQKKIIFERLKSLQNFILGQFSGFYTVTYFSILGLIIYVITSVPKTAEARLWLILIIILNAVAEYCLTGVILHNSCTKSSMK